jgi:adenylate cyclase
LFLAFSGVTLCLWFFRNIIPWYSSGALLIFFPWLLGFVHRFLSQRRRQSALERYVPRSVAHKLVSGQRTSLAPVYKELSIMFSDIRGFTSWSSDKEAQVVHGFLNTYLESMAEVLFDYGATVDKFMGDGILAFFGDPLDMNDHALQAVKAAIAMQHKVQVLNEEWKPKVDIDLKIRIGINTGKVIVGDLGTRRRIEYTVIGSAVNMAQRMENSATPGGILITEDTKTAIESQAASCPFSFNKKNDLAIKGYDKQLIAAYEVIF